jgi:hypothetical protein
VIPYKQKLLYAEEESDEKEELVFAQRRELVFD